MRSGYRFASSSRRWRSDRWGSGSTSNPTPFENSPISDSPTGFPTSGLRPRNGRWSVGTATTSGRNRGVGAPATAGPSSPCTAANCRCSSSTPSANAADPTASSRPTGCARTSRRPTRSPPRSRIGERAGPSPSRGPFWSPDGLHSAARRQRFPDEGPPLWGGAVLWRGTALGRPIRTGASFTLVGNLEQRFVHYPIGPVDLATGLSGRTSLPSHLRPSPGLGCCELESDR